MITFVVVMIGTIKYMDTLPTFDLQIKTSLAFFNIGIICLCLIFLQTPQYNGMTKYFYKLLQSVAFAYFLNIFFLVFLVS